MVVDDVNALLQSFQALGVQHDSFAVERINIVGRCLNGILDGLYRSRDSGSFEKALSVVLPCASLKTTVTF